MAKDVIPQDLLIYRDILSTALTRITNEMYAKNNKISFKFDFTLVPREEKPTVFISTAKPLYLFRVWAVDKSRNPIGECHYLYNNYYPKDITESIYAVERKAIQDWFINASKALYNYIQEDYMENIKKKQELIDERAAKGLTENVIAAELENKAKEEFARREQEILKMMHPNMK